MRIKGKQSAPRLESRLASGLTLRINETKVNKIKIEFNFMLFSGQISRDGSLL